MRAAGMGTSRPDLSGMSDDELRRIAGLDKETPAMPKAESTGAPFLPEVEAVGWEGNTIRVASRRPATNLTSMREPAPGPAPAEATRAGQGVQVSYFDPDTRELRHLYTEDLPRWKYGPRVDATPAQWARMQPEMAATAEPGQAFASGVVKGATLRLVQPFGERFAGTPTEFLGEAAGSFAPYGGAYRVAGKAIPIAKGAGLAARTVRGAARGTAVGAATGTVGSFADVVHGGTFEGMQPVKSAALFGTIDAALPTAGKLAGYVKQLVQEGKYAAAKRAFQQAAARFGSKDADLARFNDLLDRHAQAEAEMAARESAARPEALPPPVSTPERGYGKGFTYRAPTMADMAAGQPLGLPKPIGPAEQSAAVFERELALMDRINQSPIGREKLRERLAQMEKGEGGPEARPGDGGTLLGFSGALYGFEQDDEGNVSFNPRKAILGLGAGLVAARYAGSTSDMVKKMMAGKIPAKASEPILTKAAAVKTFQHETARTWLEHEAPGLVGTKFESAVRLGRMKRAGEKIRDIRGIADRARDFYRNSMVVFGDRRTGQFVPEFEREIVRPLEQARAANIAWQQAELAELQQTVEQQFGIRPWTRESRYLFRALEDRTDVGEMTRLFGEEQALRIDQAARWARGKLDGIRDQVNGVRSAVYPNDPGKQVPYRKNYIHHMQSPTGYEPLFDAFESPAGIAPALAGISAATKPKSKLLGFALPRGLRGRFTEDFYASYVKYLRDASHAIHIDPQIANLRAFRTALAEEMGARFIVRDERGGIVRTFSDRSGAEDFAAREWALVGPGGEVMGTFRNEAAAKGAMTKARKAMPVEQPMTDYQLVRRGEYLIEPEEGTGAVNAYIGYLDEYANTLAGKTNPIDRALVSGNTDTRKVLRLLDWLNRRVKGNTVLGNARSMVAQVFNLPLGAAEARAYMVPGGYDTVRGIFQPNRAMAQSGFLRERYHDSVFNKFDVSWIRRGVGLRGRAVRPYAKQFAAWMLRAGDEAATKWMWNAFHRKAVAEGVAEPIVYADRMTRQMVGGRALGEPPIWQASKVGQLITPFTLEMGNAMWALQDLALRGGPWTRAKALAVFALVSYGMNEGARKVFGDDVSFDPIQGLLEAGDILTDRNMDATDKAIRAPGRIIGELVSNVPGGQWLAYPWPEYGFELGGREMPNRRELFGSNDPTRYGTGLVVGKGLGDPLYKVFPPFAGTQVKKTIEGWGALEAGEVVDRAGRRLYDVPDDALTRARVLAFGKYATPEAREYWGSLYQEKNKRVLPPGVAVR